MPRTEILFYAEEDGTAPAIDWLASLARKPREKMVAKILRLRDLGFELRRPEADLLRDGIHELRVGFGHVNYRVLYAFVGRNVAIVSHGLTKEKAVPAAEIERAIANKARFEADCVAHTYRGAFHA